MSDRTVRRILHEDLNFLSVQNGYGSSNKRSRHRKSKNWQVLLNAVDNDDLNHDLMTDEANFHLYDNNSQHCRYWATENPRDIHQKPLHSREDYCLVLSSIFWGDRPIFL